MLAGTVLLWAPACKTVRRKERVGFSQNSELLCLHKDGTQIAPAVPKRFIHVIEQKQLSNKYIAWIRYLVPLLLFLIALIRFIKLPRELNFLELSLLFP